MSGNPCVVFLDSGKGGIPYLMGYRPYAHARTLVYVADTAEFPYGMKSSGELRHLLRERVQHIIDRFSPEAIVLACNTASVTALTWLRQRVSTPLIGVVPAVKPASAQTVNEHIGLLVTERTATGEYLHDLIGQFASDRVVVTVVASDIVKYVENHAVSLSLSASPGIDALIQKVLNEFSDADIDTLVLGCTHFVYIADLLRKHLPATSTINIIDSLSGVIGRIRVLVKDMPGSSEKAKRQVPVCHTTTVDLSPTFRQLLDTCGIRYAGML